MSGTHYPVTVRDELVFTICGGNAEQRLPSAAGAGPGNVIAAVWQLYTQKRDGSRIDIGTIACDGDRTGSSRERARGCAQPRCKVRCVTVVRDGIQDSRRGALAGDTVELPCALIATKEEDLVFHNRSAN